MKHRLAPLLARVRHGRPLGKLSQRKLHSNLMDSVRMLELPLGRKNMEKMGTQDVCGQVSAVSSLWQHDRDPRVYHILWKSSGFRASGASFSSCGISDRFVWITKRHCEHAIIAANVPEKVLQIKAFSVMSKLLLAQGTLSLLPPSPTSFRTRLPWSI